MCLPGQFSIRNSRKSLKLEEGHFAVGQGNNRENTGNLGNELEWRPCVGSVMLKYNHNLGNNDLVVQSLMQA